MPSDKIERRQNFGGTGMMNSPEYLQDLQERRELHARLIAGKPERTFGEILHEKLHGKPEGAPDGEEDDTPTRGAKDPHLGLSPTQSPDLAQSGKGRRAGRVIVKG